MSLAESCGLLPAEQVVLVGLPRFGAIPVDGRENVRGPYTEIARVVGEARPVDLAHLFARLPGQLVSKVMPCAHRDDHVLAELLLSVQVAEVAVVNLRRARLLSRLQSSIDPV